MNRHKSSSILCSFLIFYVLMATGCALSPTLKSYGTLPPTVKEAMLVKLHGTETEMVNSGIYLNEGEPYSIVAAGFLYAQWSETISLGDPALDEWTLLEFRIGQEPYFTPLSGTYYSLNGTTRISQANGNLYVALHAHRTVSKIMIAGGDVDVLIIAWKTDAGAQIVRSLQKLRKDAEKSNAHTDFINGFDDAIDRAKELGHDFGFRTLDSGFAPEIVCVKNYRRVTP